jgi:CheY-like chemotaxis protein
MIHSTSEARKCILYAEDDPDHAELVLRSFERRGLRADVVHVSDGEAALDYLLRRGAFAGATHPLPALLLLDLRMPKLDGLEVLRSVKRDPALLGLPVVVLTTSRASNDIEAAQAHHANSYLLKPAVYSDLELLLQVVERYWLLYNVPWSDA